MDPQANMYFPHKPAVLESITSEDTFKIRVITPVLARAHPNANTIPTVRGTVTSTTTLRQLRSLVASQIGVQIEDSIPQHEECNCSFARHVDDATSIDILDDTDQEGNTLVKLVVIGGANNVTFLDLEAGVTMNSASLISRIPAFCGGSIDQKVVNLIGGDLTSEAE